MQSLIDWFLQNSEGWDWSLIGLGLGMYFVAGLYYTLECYNIEGKKREVLKMMPMIFCGVFVIPYLYLYVIPHNETEALAD